MKKKTTKQIMLMIPPRMIVLVTLFFWMWVIHSLFIDGRIVLHESNQAIALLEFMIISFGTAWYFVKSFKEIQLECKKSK